jgi:glycosyltransferase involved in cell wall biosynthesis
MKKDLKNISQFHICIDCRFLDSSGIGRYIRNLIQRMIQEPNIYFTFITHQKFFGFFKEMKSNNFTVVLAKSKMYSIQEQFELPFKIPKCDVFWSPHYPIPIFPIRAKKRITTIHDVNHLVFLQGLSVMQKIYAKVMMFCSTRMSQKILTVSQFSRNEIIKHTGISHQKVDVTPIGIDKEKFYIINDRDELNNIRDKYQLPNQFILYVGNVKPHKNVQGLLKAYSLLKSKSYQEKLVIVGKKKNFINEIQDVDLILSDLGIKNDVIFTGTITDIDLLYVYNLTKVFVFPSFYEGFGLPPLEAMACGCPAIVSNVASLPEVCSDAAEYIDPYDSQDIANGIIKILDDPLYAESLIQKGLKLVQLYDWENTMKATLNIIKGVIRNEHITA